MAHYLISEAAHLVDVEPHVLRYWEDELELNIPRNELGHRYYTEQHVEMFKKIKIFKERGYQLKAIRASLYGEEDEEFDMQKSEGSILYITHANDSKMVVNNDIDEESEVSEAYNVVPSAVGEQEEIIREQRIAEFKYIMTGIVSDAIAINNEKLTVELTKDIGDRIIKEMNYIAREQEEREEERFRRFDESLRGKQRSRKAKAEAAAAKELDRKAKREARRKKRNDECETIPVTSMV